MSSKVESLLSIFYKQWKLFAFFNFEVIILLSRPVDNHIYFQHSNLQSFLCIWQPHTTRTWNLFPEHSILKTRESNFTFFLVKTVTDKTQGRKKESGIDVAQTWHESSNSQNAPWIDDINFLMFLCKDVPKKNFCRSNQCSFDF